MAGESVVSNPEMRLVDCDGQMLHVRIWNPNGGRSVVLWHGVTGTSLDHVPLAEQLAGAGFRVIAPDSLGCGLSDRARDPERGYGLGPLAEVARHMLDALATGPVDWVGTSKGGGLGIRLAGEAPARVRSLVLNDVGPTLPQQFSGALADRLAAPPRFAGLGEFRLHVARFFERNGLKPCEERLDQVAIGWAGRSASGEVSYHYDPAISNQFRHNREDFALWDFWDAISCPVLILRGGESPVLAVGEADEMVRRNASAQLHTIPGHGHVNFLDDPAHQRLILEFINNIECGLMAAARGE